MDNIITIDDENEVNEFLRTCEFRLVPSKYNNEIDVKYKGEWYSLYRKDLCDQVSSTLGGIKHPSQYESWFGAVIDHDKKTFGVIDAESDG